MSASNIATNRTRVLHLIPHLGQGGAEAALAELLAVPQPDIEHAVCTMTCKPLHFRISQTVFAGKGRRGIPSANLALHLRRVLREVKPDVLHCWMYHANLLSLASLGFGAQILWSIHSECPNYLAKRMTRQVSAVCAHLSSILPRRIVYVAEASRVQHEMAGYATAPGIVIPNGVDMARFRPPTAPHPKSESVRFGVLGRYDQKLKGQHFLIDVLATHPLRDRLQLVFAGQDCDTSERLRTHLAATGLLDRTQLIGTISDVEQIYAELDVLVVPSFSEALPMVILEGAASGLTICASRVGDIPRLGLREEALFQPGDFTDCARALSAAAALALKPDEALLQRSIVNPRFSSATMASRYARLYRSLAAAAR
jgi:glycosyltransferase involved in cell wall biosynthesis